MLERSLLFFEQCNLFRQTQVIESRYSEASHPHRVVLIGDQQPRHVRSVIFKRRVHTHHDTGLLYLFTFWKVIKIPALELLLIIGSRIGRCCLVDQMIHFIHQRNKISALFYDFALFVENCQIESQMVVEKIWPPCLERNLNRRMFFEHAGECFQQVVVTLFKLRHNLLDRIGYRDKVFAQGAR